VGILTAGGDCPGLNAVIRAAGRKLLADGHEPVGIERGYRGLAEGELGSLDTRRLSGILHLGGTILRTSSFDPRQEEDGAERIKETLSAKELDAVIAIGGEHTMEITRELYERHGLPLIGVPKTIDNDVVGTDITFGFHTAVQIATFAIDRLHTTAQSHDRVMVIEVMGRHAGWIAAYAGLAGGADAILIPERPFDMEQICARLRQRHMKRSSFSMAIGEISSTSKVPLSPGIIISTPLDNVTTPVTSVVRK
jgi:6-phosphofructokinase 1